MQEISFNQTLLRFEMSSNYRNANFAELLGIHRPVLDFFATVATTILKCEIIFVPVFATKVQVWNGYNLDGLVVVSLGYLTLGCEI